MKRTLPNDTVRIYGKCKLDYLIKPRRNMQNGVFEQPPFTFWYQTGNIKKLKLVLPNGYVIVADYNIKNQCVSLDFSIPRLAKQDNCHLLTLEQAKDAVDALITLTGLPLKAFTLNRVDITHDFAFKPTSFKTLKPQLQAPKGYLPERRDFDDSHNFCFHSTPKANTGQCNKYLLFYAKEGRTRMESRLVSVQQIKGTLGASENLTLKDLLTDAFIDRAEEYLTDLLTQITGKNRNPLVTGFRNRALESLGTPALC